MPIGTCEKCGMKVVWNTLEISAHIDRFHNVTNPVTMNDPEVLR